MSNVDRVIVRNTESGEVGEIRRNLFESSVFNPGGLLLIEVEDTRSGCVDCGIEPCDTEDTTQDEVASDDLLEETTYEEEDED